MIGNGIDMIKTRRLFLIPTLGLFLFLIPVIGIILYIGLCCAWYLKYQSEIHLYFSGVNYKRKEMSEEEKESLK